jgi:putative sigma-54 modulation protein
MQIHFTGHQIEVTQALKQFTEEKLNKLERHFDKITSIHIVFDVQKLRQIAEATVFISKGEVHAHAESEDMYTAIDLLVDKLDRQLIKHKEKIQDHRDHRDHHGWQEETE